MATVITTLLVAGFGALAVLLVNNQQAQIRAHIDDFGQLIASQLAMTATEPLFTDEHYELAALVKRFADNPRILGAVIYDTKGKLIAGAGVQPDFALLPEPGEAAERRFGASAERPALRAIVISAPVTFRGTEAGKVALALSRQALDNAQREIIRNTAIITALLSIAICLVAIYLGKRMARPIHTLVDATRLLQSGEFSELPKRRGDEFDHLFEAINSMGEGLVRKAQVENILRQCLDSNVATKLLDQIEPVALGGDQVEATVLFADIVGFTSLSEKMSPEQVGEFLAEIFHYLDQCARVYGGTVDKFIGDAVMVIFGAPHKDPEHAYHAIACAVLMQQAVRRMNRQRRLRGEAPVQVRVGLNSGEMFAGLLGSTQRMDYTVVGDAVNLASRLCNEARPGEILVSAPLYRAIKGRPGLRAAHPRRINIRGKREPVTICSVIDIDQDGIGDVDLWLDQLTRPGVPA
jgi:adenylate cyclase